MATDITEALQGAGAVSAKPVTMEAIPEATIDVGGGSQSLDIEGLGVKRRKDDLSVATASTSGIAVEDLFGDLLDEVNFSDPTSVDAFREAAASRINEFDSNTFSSILGEASTVAGDLATFASGFQGSSQPQQQFEQVFGPPSITSGDDAGGIGLDTATSTEAEDLSSLSNPGLAAGLVGGTFSALGPGAGFSGLGTSIAASAIGQADVVGALGGFSAAQSLANAEITDPASAFSAASAALAVGQTAANVADLVNSNATVTDLFDRAVNNVEEFIGGIVSAVSNPEQAISAFGLEMAYGTTTPDLYSFDFPGGKMSFAFDAKTGAIAVPGAISAIMGRSPLGAFYDIAQIGLEKFGYTGAMADRNQSAINAFSMPGVQFDQMSIHTGPQGATTGIDPETGAPSSVGAFGAIDMSNQGFGMVGMDLGALSSAMGAGTIGDLSFTDFQDAAISGHLGHGPLGIDEEAAVAADIAGAFGAAGISTSEDLSNAIDQAGVAAEAFTSSLQSFGIDITSAQVDTAGRAGALSSSPAAAARGARAQSPQAFQMALIDALDPAAQLMTAQELEAQAKAERNTQMEMQAAAGRSYAVSLGGYGGGGYNSQNPSMEALAMADYTMSITGKNTFSEFSTEDAAIAGQVGDIMGAFGFESVEATIDAMQNEPLSGMDEALSGGAGAGAAADPGPSFDPADEADEGSWDSDGGDGGGGDSKVICTALKDMGLLDKELWQHDGAYGRTLPLETRQGYWAWGVPTAKFIRKNRWAAKAIRPVVTEVAKEMAHRVGYGKGSKLGATLLYVGLPMCRVINRIKNDRNNTRSVYS